MHKCLVAFALFLVFFSVSAQAIQVNAPATVVMQQEQKEIGITVLNDSFGEQDYSIRLLAPFNAFASPSAGRLGPGKSIIASLSITPEERLEASTYQATLEVVLGEEKALKEISVIFKEAEVEGNGSKTGEPVGTGFFSLGSFSAFALAALSWENALNVGLALVAAVLLIAFIARFVKRLEAEK